MLSPLIIAANTKSLPFKDIICDRITRAFQAHPVRINTPASVKGPGGNQLAKITIKGKPGITKKTLIIRDKKSSTLPP